MPVTRHCTNRPDSLDLRLATRPLQRQHREAQPGTFVVARPVLQGKRKPRGSLRVPVLPDSAHVEAFIALSPCVKAGMSGSVAANRRRIVFRNGEQVSG
jgi:uncharacterized protein YciI